LAFIANQKILHVKYDLDIDRNFIENIFMISDSTMFYRMGENEEELSLHISPSSEMIKKLLKP
jgi:hypothetical protein